MIDFKTMFEREKTREIVLFLAGRNEKGISHPHLDGICTRHGGNCISNIELIHLVRDMQYKNEIQSNGKGGYKRGHLWQNPQFVTEKKYGIE